jgi:hypothetical protein
MDMAAPPVWFDYLNLEKLIPSSRIVRAWMPTYTGLLNFPSIANF